jgi:low affinity Fe/Cu permease
MRKEKTLFIIALWVIILPFLGFPQSWQKVLFFITGVAFIYLAYLFYLETKIRLLKKDDQSKTFIDNIEDTE